MKLSTLVTLTAASTLAILSKSTVDATTYPCSGKCPSVVAPVCGQNAAGVTRTWINSCELTKSNCQSPGDIYTKISNKACPGDDMVKRDIFDRPVPVPISRVCAQNNVGVQVTFVNSCRLSVAQCQYPDEKWTQISKGYCPGDLNKRGVFDGLLSLSGCPKTCPSVIERVCAQNNVGVQRTFVNFCTLSTAQCQYPTEGWTKVSDGFCLGDLNKKKRAIWDQPIPEPECSQDCPSVISPVCAQNQVGTQKTFVNSCQCQFPAEGWTKFSDKTCIGDLD
ncbi:hypothetical protein BG015_008863 [Linnemannia schmuckeri]|uniref:Kazal-like domain-containing protein n=1 Tax=Linnemannia schmuckeri TaxID=64567 RepID=A0A9P5RWV9_9FUNG|nr:hypothetical protein BG015_008863 [Linnemannia schmuckeri]